MPQDSAHCSRCGTPLTDAKPPASLTEHGDASNYMAVAPSPAVMPQLRTDETPATENPSSLMSGVPYLESDWTEFSGVQAPMGTSANVRGMYPPLSPVPGATLSSSNYPPLPGPLPSVTSAPKRRGRMLAMTLILSVLVLLLVFGSLLVGIRIGQGSSASRQATTNHTARLSSDPNQLYKQIVSQPPTFVDTLQDASLSSWSVYEKPTYGCEVKSDGLHVHTRDTGYFSDCTSGRGKFSNFALQVDMKLLVGNGGGLVFRADTVGGNFYYFHVFPDGRYIIRIQQNHETGPELSAGTISSFSAGPGQNNTLMVIAQGSELYFYVNQWFLTKAQDSTYSNGYLGVMADDSDTPADVVYTNARIWNL